MDDIKDFFKSTRFSIMGDRVTSSLVKAATELQQFFPQSKHLHLFQIGDRDRFVGLVHRRIEESELDHRAQGAQEACVGGAAGRR